jgi:hypothetical protein
MAGSKSSTATKTSVVGLSAGFNILFHHVAVCLRPSLLCHKIHRRSNAGMAHQFALYLIGASVESPG